MNDEFVLSPAIKVEDIIIMCLYHDDLQAWAMLGQLEINGFDLENTPIIKGFISNKFRFLNRKEAFKMAKMKNQITVTIEKDREILFDSDLY